MARRGLLLLSGLLAGLAGCAPVRRARALPAGPGETARDLAYGEGARRQLDLSLPAGPARALVVFVYGGAWRSGGRGTYGFIARALGGIGCAVAIPDYRVWPEAGWPGFVEDAAAAVAWVRGPAGRAAGAPDAPLILMGHSAGAYIALALAADPRWLAAAGLPGGRAAVAGAIGLAGPYDFVPREPPFPAIFAAAPEGRGRVAPDDATLPGTPPTLLLHGDADRTVEPEQTTRFAARLAAARVSVTTRLYPGVGHIGIAAALAGPLRAIGLASAPVLEDVDAFLAARG